MTDQTMPQPAQELQRINWPACFPFTRLFGTFRMAVQPGKLGLALAAVLLTMIWGRLLDGLWSTRCQPPTAEVQAFWQKADLASWREATRAGWPAMLQRACQPMKIRLPERLGERLADDPGGEFDRILGEIRGTGRKEIDRQTEQLDKDTKKSDEAKREEIARLAQSYADAYGMVEAIQPRGVFRSFVDFESDVGRQLLSAAIGLNFAGGLTDVLTTRTETRAAAIALGGLGLDGLIRAHGGADGLGVLACGVLALRGMQWMVCEHFWFALLWGLPVLAVWGLFGGAICRMAALNFARDERPAPKVALKFAQQKLASFFTAPLLPISLVLLPGVVLFVGGLVTAIPYLGDLIGGIGAIGALVAGLLMAVVVVGGLAGGPLLWPTIAVEGSDGFDAISRGYSYVFSRPWRSAFYAGVLTVYGAICYLFARFFVLLGLKAARVFVGAGMGLTDRPATGAAGASKIDVLWPAPTWADLQPAGPPFGAEGWDPLAGWLVGIWLAIVIALLCAFVSSFFLSGSTAIYYLLRREVDATDFEEVFLEDEEDEDREFDVPEAAGEIGALSSSAGGGERAGAASESTSRPPADSMNQPNPPAAGDGDIDAE